MKAIMGWLLMKWCNCRKPIRAGAWRRGRRTGAARRTGPTCCRRPGGPGRWPPHASGERATGLRAGAGRRGGAGPHDAAETLDKALLDVLGPDPAVVLAKETQDADLPVIGRHGHGELPGMHLGSIASYCVHDAPCPVTIVCHTRP